MGLFAVMIAAKLWYLAVAGFSSAVTVGIWCIFAYLLLNTPGNLTAPTLVERLVFTPLTILLARCVRRVAGEP